MSLIDLSLPNNNLATNIGNDLSGLGSLQNNPSAPSIVNASVVDENNSVMNNLRQENHHLPDLSSLNSITSPTVNISKQNPNINTPDDQIKSEISEEHIMMRNMPLDNQQPSSITNGIKEFKGPEFETVNITTKVVNTLPPLNVASEPQSITQSNNQSNNIKEKINIEKPIFDNQVIINRQETTATNIKTVEIPNVKVENVVSQPIITQQVVKPIENTLVADHLSSESQISENSIDKILEVLVQKGSSDLHIAVGFPPTMRVDGKLVAIGNQDLTAIDTKNLLTPLLNNRLQDELTENMDVDFSYTYKATGIRFRVNVFWSKGTMAAAFRLITSKIKTISELNLPNICFDLIKKPHGLILLTGPTGSGKSTSIAAMIQEINMTEAKHIVTIEDPIEYIFPRALSLVNQREIGGDASNWQRALRELLRQDPNIVVVGEMRDHETIASTITVAETGHLVFATLHTNSASQTMDRIIDVFPDAQQPQIRAQLATVITAVISQRLVPIKSGGRKAIFEVMIANSAVKNAIREGKTYQIDNIIQTNADQGMITLEKSLVGLIRNGEVSVEKALEYTTKPDELQSLLQGN